MAGEKIPRDLYIVLAARDGQWTEIKHWRELPKTPEQLFVLPRGLESATELFEQTGWSGYGSVDTGSGKKGERAPKSWRESDAMSVYAMRAQSQHIYAAGARQLRDNAIVSLLEGDSPLRLCEALWVSPDGRLASLASLHHRPSAKMIAAMAQSGSDHLRVRAARLSRDKKTLAKLLEDPSENVKRAAIANENSAWRDIIKKDRETSLLPEILGRDGADEMMLQEAIEDGGLGARVAIAHPKMAQTAQRMLKRGNRLSSFAAANPRLDVTVALDALLEDQEVCSVVAGNSGVVSRMTSKQAEGFIEILADRGMAEEIGMVARWAKLSKAAQKRLLDGDLSEIVAWGLSLSQHISEESQMTLLGHCSAVGVYSDREDILSNLCSNEKCMTSVLAAADTTTPRVAIAVKSNQQTSGTIRDEARKNWEISVAKREKELTELMKNARGVSAPRERVRHINEYGTEPRPVAAVNITERVLESSAVFQKDAGVWSMGGNRIDMNGVIYGGVEHTILTLRVDVKRAQEAMETNWIVDSVGVCLTTPEGEIFQLIEPRGHLRGREITTVDEAQEGLFETRREQMVRQAKRITTGLDSHTILTQGAKLVPGGSTAVKRVKNLVEFEKIILGKPRGQDRTAVLPIAVMPGDTLSVLLPDCKRSESIDRTLEYVRELRTCGRITEDQRDTVSLWVENLENRARKSLAANTLPARYLDMLRYQAGRRKVIDMIVNGETPWQEEMR